MRRFALAAMLMLGACNPSEPPAATGVTNDIDAAAATEDPGEDIGVPVAVATPVQTSLLLSLAPDGLRLVDGDSGKTYPIDFGTPRQDALDRVMKARGAVVDQGDNDECGAGPLSYANFGGNLSLLFQEGKFAGWSINEGGDAKVTTMDGIGLGSTRKALGSAYQITVEESTIGTEFNAGDLSGLLSGKGDDAKITDIWAGVTCIAR